MKSRFTIRLITVCIVGGAIVAACSGTSTTSKPVQSQSALTVSPFSTTSSPMPEPIGAQTISFSFTAAGQAAAFLAQESQYTGSFTITNTCTGIATITPTSGTGPAAAFNVTASAAGNCVVTVHDAAANTASVLITVTTTSGTIT